MSKLVTIFSPLSEQAFELISLTGDEKLSSLYQFDLKLRYHDKALQPKELIGKPFTVQMMLANQKTRFFTGIVSRFSDGLDAEHRYCNLRLVPKLWQLQSTCSSRVFQQASIKTIITQLLKKYGIDHNTSKLNGTYPTLDYCVQWQESDFAFISRLMEAAGIFYYFEHQKNSHPLILADNINAYKDCLKQAKTISLQQAYAQISSWQVAHQFYAGKATVANHDFTKPKKQLLASSKALKPIANNENYEIYTYPSDHQTTDQGSQLSKLRMEQLEMNALIGYGSSTYPELLLCGKLSFDEQQMPAERGKTYVITELQHELIATPNNTLNYHNHFLAIPAQTIFRPAPVTPKPMAPSTQLATIVGPAGKEIYTDQYGRMKVQFMWDHDGKNNEKSSCWIRAIQHWEGLLRIGTPVVIGFVDGDLNQPLIMGPVYNAELMPLYTLEEQQTKSSLKRRLIKKADEKKYNEIRFEDKKDQQELYLHATKDLLIEVENDATHTIKEGDLKISVSKGKCVIQVKGDISIKTDGGISLDAKQAINLKSNNSINLKANNDISLSGKNINLDAQMNVQTKAGVKLTQQAVEIATTGTARINLKAPLQSIQSDGLLTLKGGLIKEN